MIINCNKCNKSFNVKEDLIPAKGRLLQCGNCQYKWFFSAISNSDFIDTNQDTNIKNRKFEKKQKLFDDGKQDRKLSKSIKNNIHRKKNNQNILGKFLIIIITFISIILILDTFKQSLSVILPGINPMLDNLYETLYDLRLFLKDLFN